MIEKFSLKKLIFRKVYFYNYSHFARVPFEFFYSLCFKKRIFDIFFLIVLGNISFQKCRRKILRF